MRCLLQRIRATTQRLIHPLLIVSFGAFVLFVILDVASFMSNRLPRLAASETPVSTIVAPILPPLPLSPAPNIVAPRLDGDGELFRLNDARK